MASLHAFLLYLYIYLFADSCKHVFGECSVKDGLDYTQSQEWGGFYKVHYNPMTWENARLTCREEGAGIAMPYTAEETRILGQIISSPQLRSGIFAGGKEMQSKGQMDFETNEGISIHHKPDEKANNVNEPNSFSERCRVLLQNGTFDNEPCTELLPFVCYKKFDDDCNPHQNPCMENASGYKFEQRTGSCYKFHNNALTWARSFKTCADEGAHLAIINSDTESAILRDMFAEYPDEIIDGGASSDVIHVGFHDLFEHGEWVNIDGKNLTESGFASWSPGEPDNDGDEQHCGCMYRTGLLSDCRCFTDGAFICEIDRKSPVCNPHQNPCMENASGYKFEQRTGSCYKFHNNALTWARSFKTCADEGAHLAIINSDAESAILRDMFAEYPDEIIDGGASSDVIHVGFHDLFEHGEWVNIDGKNLTESGFASWSPGEPDNDGDEQHCGCMYRTGLLSDCRCFTDGAFICEIDRKSPVCHSE